MRFEITILGSGSATPSVRRNPSAQLINIQEHYFLMDCGEGTQLQLRKFKCKFQSINRIFISHLHGDHYLGLIGLLQSFHLLGRKHDLHIHADQQLQTLIEQHLQVSYTKLNYALVYHPLSYSEKVLVFENNQVEIYSFPLKHRIPCCGFEFREKQKARSIIPEKITELAIPTYAMHTLKMGENFTLEDGRVIAYLEATNKPKKSYAYAYCSDTCYSEKIIPYIENVDVLYHESTFTSEMTKRAKETFHSTAEQAAKIAAKAKVEQLVLGHFSLRYKDVSKFLDEAQAVFKNTILAEDGLIVKVY